GTIHIGLLFLAVSWIVLFAIAWHSPLLPNSRWKPTGPEHPVLRLLVLLSVSAGLPYLTLSTTGPILQTWFARAYPSKTPYRLYALSNFGSFLGLLSYPFAIEPWLTVRVQAACWTLGFLVFVGLCAYCALRVKQPGSARSATGPSASVNQLPSEGPAF